MLKLLVVDDSGVMRRLIARLLKNLDQEVFLVGSAADGEEALSSARRTQPNLITLDLTMPNMDGLETVPLLSREHPSARILVISALADKATCIRALQLGAHGFLTKPVSEERLINAMNGLIEQLEP